MQSNWRVVCSNWPLINNFLFLPRCWCTQIKCGFAHGVRSESTNCKIFGASLYSSSLVCFAHGYGSVHCPTAFSINKCMNISVPASSIFKIHEEKERIQPENKGQTYAFYAKCKCKRKRTWNMEWKKKRPWFLREKVSKLKRAESSNSVRSTGC